MLKKLPREMKTLIVLMLKLLFLTFATLSDFGNVLRITIEGRYGFNIAMSRMVLQMRHIGQHLRAR